MTTFAEKLKALRVEAEISQQKLSEALGITVRTISSYELGHTYPNFEQLSKIARFFGVSADSFMNDNEHFISQAYEASGRKGARQASELIDEVVGLFAGGRLTEDDRDAAMRAIQESQSLINTNFTAQHSR